ncbi:peptidoglycan-binding protein [Euzebya tangerina]|uniref:peptidoglycan-binding protein n=1 Tax=Euzebya tangerina TaxID=591198 RepID=UPI000E322DA8|nr:peptidoglycan-binding protein [Euzebya tangerina]
MGRNLTRRSSVTLAVAGLLLLSLAAAGWFGSDRADAGTEDPVTADDASANGDAAEPGSDTSGDSPGTAPVRVTDLVEETTLTGSISSGDPVTISAGRDGTVTAVAGDADRLERGDVIYAVDAVDVVALYGDLPHYRPLALGDTGDDVHQLEANLLALEFDADGALDVDGAFDENTQAGLVAFQAEYGLPQSGELDPGTVHVMDGPALVSENAVSKGQRVQTGSLVLTVVVTDVVTVVSGGPDSGVITGRIEVETAVEHGSVVLEVEGDPVVAVISHTRFDRELSLDAVGDDVRALEEALTSLGFDAAGDLEVDDTYDDTTAEAVADWEGSLDLPEDGIVQVGQVVGVPPETTVSRVHVEVGDELTSRTVLFEEVRTTQTVVAEVPLDEQALVAVGDEVRVTLPDGTEVPGTVEEIAAIATRSTVPDEDDYVEMTVRTDLSSAAGWVDAPVDVDAVEVVSEGVMVVPSGALVALQEGGFAVEVVGRGLVGVSTGDFVDGLVEVAGDLAEGDAVVVAR